MARTGGARNGRFLERGRPRDGRFTRWDGPTTVAGAFLASDDAQCVTGTVLSADGGTSAKAAIPNITAVLVTSDPSLPASSPGSAPAG